MAKPYTSIDDYVATFPADVQVILEEVRRTIHAAVPGCGERISYQIPAVTLGGRTLVSFAAWEHHLGLYPLPDGDAVLAAELAPYRSGSSTARFPFRDPVPYALIGRIAECMAAQRRGAPR